MESEIILEIKEIEDVHTKFDRFNMVGYLIKTNKQEIKFLISDGQSCCENYGYFSSHDNFDDFINAKLLNIKTVNNIFNVSLLELDEYTNLSQDDCIFLNVETDKGTLQFTVYNQHNGYYGHSVEIRSNQLQLETGI